MPRLIVFRFAPLVVLAALVLTPATAPAITLGQIDDFEDETTQSWEIGINVGTPSIQTTGGPGGADDTYLTYTSSGGSVAGRMIFFNTDQWTGDYLSAGVTQISADFLVENTQLPLPLNLRLAFGTTRSANSGTWFASTESFDLSFGDGWQNATFDLDEASFTSVLGSDSFADVMSNVGAVRVLSSASPANKGDVLVATLGVDNLTAIGGPEPIDGDFNADGSVDNGDLNLLLGSWGSANQPAGWLQGFEAPVDNGELNALLGNWGAGVTAVPEPAAALLVVLAAVGAARRR